MNNGTACVLAGLSVTVDFKGNYSSFVKEPVLGNSELSYEFEAVSR
jgi:hypothetical protein